MASVHLDYDAGKVSGWKLAKGVRTPVAVTFKQPVWEGALRLGAPRG